MSYLTMNENIALAFSAVLLVALAVTMFKEFKEYL